MSHPKVTAVWFTDLLIAIPAQATATDARRTRPDSSDPATHVAYTRLSHRLESDSDSLWNEVRPNVCRTYGVLVPDDSVLSKPYAGKMDLVHHSWSGKRHRVVTTIGLL